MHELTEAQMKLLRLIDQGLTYNEIGAELGIGARTAKAHTDKLRWTFGVKKKRHLPRVARELGLL